MIPVADSLLDCSGGSPGVVKESDLMFCVVGAGVRGGDMERQLKECGREGESVARGVTSPKTALLRGGVEGSSLPNASIIAVLSLMAVSESSSSEKPLLKVPFWRLVAIG